MTAAWHWRDSWETPEESSCRQRLLTGASHFGGPHPKSLSQRARDFYLPFSQGDQGPVETFASLRCTRF